MRAIRHTGELKFSLANTVLIRCITILLLLSFFLSAFVANKDLAAPSEVCSTTYQRSPKKHESNEVNDSITFTAQVQH